jgi:hypothetical protein
LSTCFIEWCKWLHLCSFCVHLQAKFSISMCYDCLGPHMKLLSTGCKHLNENQKWAMTWTIIFIILASPCQSRVCR